MRNLIVLSIVFWALSSCLKKEIPVAKHEAGNVITSSISLETDYRYQAFYDMETNQYVKQNVKTDWSLGFSSTNTAIILNSSLAMAIGKSTQNFDAVSDTAGLTWSYDKSSGYLDSTAIGDWQTDNFVYVVNLGTSYDGTVFGLKKMDILSWNAGEFQVRVANLDGTSDETVTITTDAEYNFSFLSLIDNQLKDIQPPKAEWDLVFTQYSHLFEPHFPYLVTGILANRNGVEIAEIFDKPFAEITLSDAQNANFSTNIDEIGYDWKSFTGSGYVIHDDKNYVVKSTEGIFFKLHFIDFYDALGNKGTPTFEIQQL